MATKIRFRPEEAEGEIESGAGQIDPDYIHFYYLSRHLPVVNS